MALDKRRFVLILHKSYYFRENGCILRLALGVVSHIGMSVVHGFLCQAVQVPRDEVSEQDSSEEIFHLVAVF